MSISNRSVTVHNLFICTKSNTHKQTNYHECTQFHAKKKRKEKFNERPLFVCLVWRDKVKYSPVSVIDICSRTNTVLEKKINITNKTHIHILSKCSAISAWIGACQVIHRSIYPSVSLSLFILNCESILAEMANRQHSFQDVLQKVSVQSKRSVYTTRCPWCWTDFVSTRQNKEEFDGERDSVSVINCLRFWFVCVMAMVWMCYD